MHSPPLHCQSPTRGVRLSPPMDPPARHGRRHPRLTGAFPPGVAHRVGLDTRVITRSHRPSVVQGSVAPLCSSSPLPDIWRPLNFALSEFLPRAIFPLRFLYLDAHFVLAHDMDKGLCCDSPGRAVEGFVRHPHVRGTLRTPPGLSTPEVHV